MNSRPELRLDWCSHEAAKYAVEKWHYSRSMPSAGVKIGVWEDGQFIGAICFGVGAGCSTDGRQYGLARSHEIAELVRVALTRHVSPVSKIVAVAIRMLRKQSPNLRMLISFADPCQEHHGGIYQAGNWIYTGQSAGDRVFIVRGKRMHPKTVHSNGWVQQGAWLRQHVDPRAGCETVTGKHRYLMPLDDDMRAKIAPLAKPYPKRAGSAVGGTSAIHAERGGSIPTPALSDIPTDT